LFFGIQFADNLRKNRTNGGNSMPLMEKDLVLTTDQAIEYLKISKPTFLKYIRLGRIKAIKAGKGWRILQSELYRFLKGEENR
jgi:excisionase family DNA binding protein